MACLNHVKITLEIEINLAEDSHKIGPKFYARGHPERKCAPRGGRGFAQKRTRVKGGEGPSVSTLLKHFMQVIFVSLSYSRKSFFPTT